MERGSSRAKLGRTEALTFFSAEEVARARSYHRALYWAGAVDVAIEAGVLATLVWSGAGAALDPGSLAWWSRTPAYAAIVVVAAAAVRTPLALWSGLIRERRWGFTTQRLVSWVADRAKAVGVNIVLTAVALLGLVGFARALPGWWAAPAAAAFAFAALLLSFLAPVVLEPLFNRYSPLQDATLAAELRRLAERAGVPVRDRARANAAGRGVRHPARTGVASGSAARCRPRARSPARAARAARNPARDGRRNHRNGRCLGAARPTRRRPAPSSARASHRARDRSRLAAGTNGQLPSLGARRRPLLARAHRRPGRLRDRLPATRPDEPHRPRSAAPALPAALHAPDPA